MTVAYRERCIQWEIFKTKIRPVYMYSSSCQVKSDCSDVFLGLLKCSQCLLCNVIECNVM